MGPPLWKRRDRSGAVERKKLSYKARTTLMGAGQLWSGRGPSDLPHVDQPWGVVCHEIAQAVKV